MKIHLVLPICLLLFFTISCEYKEDFIAKEGSFDYSLEQAKISM